MPMSWAHCPTYGQQTQCSRPAVYHAIEPPISGQSRPLTWSSSTALRDELSCRRIVRVDAALAQQGTQAVDFAAQLVALLGQRCQVGVRGRPLFLASSLLGQQLPSPVAQRGGLLVLLGVGSGLSITVGLVDLPVQVAGVWPGAHALLDGRQA